MESFLAATQWSTTYELSHGVGQYDEIKFERDYKRSLNLVRLPFF